MTFLLSNKVVFDYRNAELRHVTMEIEIKLDPLELAILNDLVQSQGQLVPYEQLFRHWSSRYVSDGVLSRVISSLRNKFKRFDDAEISIQNRPKQGYILVADIRAKNLPTKKERQARYYVAAAAAAFIILVAAVTNFIPTTDSEPSAQMEYKSLASAIGRKAMLSFNPSFTHLSYSFLNPQTNKEELSIVTLVNGKTFQYSELHHLYSPVWLNESKLIFRAKSENYCRIKIAELNQDQQITQVSDAASCNSESYMGDIEVLDENTVIFTDSTTPFGPAQLFQLDLNSFKTKLIPFDNLMAFGVYKVVASPNSNLVTLLINDDYKSTLIKMVNLKTGDQDIASMRVDTVLHSVAWDGKTLVARSEAGNLNYYKLDGDTFELEKTVPVFGLFVGVVNVPNGVAFIFGRNYVRQLYVQDFDQQIIEQITELADSSAYQAFFGSDDDIYFVSDETGIEQVRKINLKTGENLQLSDFVESKVISKLSTNDSQTMLALETDVGIELYSVNQENNKLTAITEMPGIWPVVTESEVFFAQTENSMITLKRLDFGSGEIDVVQEGARIGNRYKGEIIFTFEQRAGIWRLNDGEPEMLFHTTGDIVEMNVKGNEIHFRDLSEQYYIYDGRHVNEAPAAPDGYQINDIQGSILLLNKAVVNHTKVVSLQEKKAN